MKKSTDIAKMIAQKKAVVQATVELATKENRELTAEEKTLIDGIQGIGENPGELAALKEDYDRAVRFEARVDEIAGDIGQKRSTANAVDPRVVVPARARAATPLKAFKNDEDAYVSGRFLQATFGKNKAARQWCKEHGVMFNAMSEGDSQKGGVFVPHVFERTFVSLTEQFGVFEANARVVQMTSETQSFPRRLSGLTVYFPGEGGTITDSDMTANDVNMTARKAATLTKLSSELSEDAIIAIADLLAFEMGYAHAVKKDQIGFLGDGTATYGTMVGLDNALLAGTTVTATSTTIGALTVAECAAVVAKLPRYSGIMPKWYIHSSLYWNGPGRLQLAAGGNMVEQLAGGPQLTFLGYPVVFTQALSNAGTTGTTWAFFGDLGMTATMGVRRGLAVASDSSIYFANDQIAVRSTHRYDIRVHETGTASAAGPMIKCKLG